MSDRYLVEQYDSKGKRVQIDIRTEIDPDKFIQTANLRPDEFKDIYELKITKLVDTTTYRTQQFIRVS